MPIPITIPGRELYDEANNRFIDIPTTTVVLEHSLISLSKWEAKWHKAYLTDKKKTKEEVTDYYRSMVVGQKPVDPLVFLCLTRKNRQDIENYINDPMTATTFSRQNAKGRREIITNELIYYWMAELGIPFQPCEKWHLNHLLTLINVASIKRQPSKKMSPSSIAKRNHALNAARRKQHGTRG